MKKIIFSSFFLFVFVFSSKAQANPRSYLDPIKTELEKQWPNNRTVNLVFHGHSVPSGYFKTPEVHTLQAYPALVLNDVKQHYPFAVVNSIVTAIGGENSAQGAARFDSTALTHRPDVLFIDYALNDRYIGLKKSKTAWKSMIEKALALDIKVVLLTPTPDLSVDILDDNSLLAQLAQQIRDLAAEYETGLVDSYAEFKSLVASGEKPEDYMSQVNHPNEKGHQVVASLIMKFFLP